MKHKVISVFLLLFILAGATLSAELSESAFYVKTIYAIRVYNDKLGFRVDYQTANMELHAVYMPTEWFEGTAAYGEVIYGNHPSAPYLSIFYKDSKIDHFRLYVKEQFDDPSWGVMRNAGASEEDFDIEVLSLVY